MPKMSKKSEKSSNRSGVPSPQSKAKTSLTSWIKSLVREKPEISSLRQTIEGYIDEPKNPDGSSISAQEHLLLSNILKLRDINVLNIMVPRADIVAIEADISKDDLLSLLAERQFSRMPVYRNTLDEVIGTIHIKDIVSALARNEEIDIQKIVTDIPIVSPSLPILDLLLEMQKNKRHIVLVVDEFGGIDGLVTVNDVIESIVGEIDDEHIGDDENSIIDKDDGSVIADGRVGISEFETRFGAILSEEEREESDTLAGLVFSIAGRVPARGEILTHKSGMVFEILDADPRRINRLRIRNIPTF